MLITKPIYLEYSLENVQSRQRMPLIDSLRDSLEGSHTIAPSWVWPAATNASHTSPTSPTSSDTSNPTNSIQAVRIRAKYYGGLVIIYRPFLRMLLNNDLPGVAASEKIHTVSPLVWEYAKCCVEALVKSTQAFHGVGRGILAYSNPWGTAFAWVFFPLSPLNRYDEKGP